MTTEGFHARDGWYFRRVDTGVEIRCTTGSVTLDASTWASVVASVSAGGETAESYRAALAFHSGRPAELIVPADMAGVPLHPGWVLAREGPIIP